jgi:predicted small lipoprotein YifL
LTTTPAGPFNMHRYTLFTSISLLTVFAATSDAQSQVGPLAYPPASKGTQVDE